MSRGRRLRGSIARVFPEWGCGFIRLDDGEEVYFHRDALRQLDLASLVPEQPVELEVGLAACCRQAGRVFRTDADHGRLPDGAPGKRLARLG